MQKTRIVLFLIAIFFFLMGTPLWAMQPEIIWIENPSEEYTVYYYGYDPFSDLRYQPAEYGEGLYSVICLKGELDYTALSPDGCGNFYQGYVNQSGSWILPPIYNVGDTFNDGIAQVNQPNIEQQNGVTHYCDIDHIIDRNGKSIPAIDNLTQQGYTIDAVGDSYVVLSIREKFDSTAYFALANLKGTLLLPAIFLDIHLPSEGLCLVQTDKGYGFSDLNGKIVIPLQYQNGSNFSQGLATVQQNDKWGYIDKTGKKVIDFKYECALPFEDGLAAVQQDGKWGFIDKTGNMIIAPTYEEVQSFSEGIASVCKGNLWGCIDKCGNEILPCQYQAVEICSDNRIAVKWQNRYGYFDRNGEKVIDFLYGAATDFHEGVAVVSSGDFSSCYWESYWYIGIESAVYKNNQFGVIDRWGNEVLPEEYLCISDFEDGTAICQRNRDKKVGIIQAPAVQETDPGRRSFIRLYVNDKLLSTDQSPVLKNGRTMVPLRTIAEALNADVRWDKTAKAALITTDEITMQLPTDSTAATVNGEQVLLDTSAQVINGRTMVPLRFVAEQFALQVQWKADSYSVRLSTQ